MHRNSKEIVSTFIREPTESIEKHTFNDLAEHIDSEKLQNFLDYLNLDGNFHRACLRADLSPEYVKGLSKISAPLQACIDESLVSGAFLFQDALEMTISDITFKQGTLEDFRKLHAIITEKRKQLEKKRPKPQEAAISFDTAWAELDSTEDMNEPSLTDGKQLVPTEST